MEAVSTINTAPPSPPRSLWQSLWEAIRGSHQDYTTGSLNRAILLLAVPMVLEMVLESLFAVVDVFWVGRLGANAIATVGLTESLLSLIFAVGIGLSMSTTAMVARRIGEKDPEGAAVAGVQAIVLGLITSVAIGIPCFIYAPQLLHLMGASDDIVSTGGGYARIALGGSGAILMLFLNNAIFRGAGDAAIAMRLLWVSNIINLVLDPCLIFGWGPFPRLGVTGALVLPEQLDPLGQPGHLTGPGRIRGRQDRRRPSGSHVPCDCGHGSAPPSFACSPPGAGSSRRAAQGTQGRPS